MTINYLAILVMSIVSFAGGAAWFGPLFGKVWMKLHHDHKLSKEEMGENMKGMWKSMTVEFLAILLMNTFLYFIVIQSSAAFFAMGTAFYIWLGFVLPSITSSVLWGNNIKGTLVKKIALSAGYRLIVMLASAYIFFVW